MAQLHALRLADRQEMDNIQIDNSHFFQIKHDPMVAGVGFSLQVLHMLRFDPAAEADNRLLSIGNGFDLQHGLQDPALQ